MTKSKGITWSIGLGVAGASALFLGLAQSKTTRLQSEVRTLRATVENVEELELRRARLLALQVSPNELAQLRRDHEETAQIREALTKLGHKSIADELIRRATSNTRLAGPAAAVSRGQAEPSSSIENRGNQSPPATLETVVWAASAGNVEALTPLIAFESEGQAEALKVFQRLPAQVRTDYGNAEKVYATLLAASLPLGTTRISTLRGHVEGDDQAKISVRLHREDGSARDAEFKFRRSGEAWQLIMPDRVVKKYGQMLTAP